MASTSFTITHTARERFTAFVRSLDLLGLTSALTLALVVIFGFEHWMTKIVTPVMLVGALVVPSVVRNHVFWLILALASTYALATDWFTADNHKYLLVYWLFVVWVCHLQPSREEGEAVLRWHARFFLIFIFLAAAARKFSTPSYMSGEMFELVIFLDDRFKAFAHLVGIDISIMEQARKLSLVFRSPLSEVDGNVLQMPATAWSKTVAKLVTWYDLYVQVAIGALFVPRRHDTDLAAHILLLFFIFTTYLPAPVFGFGWTLTILGLVVAYNRFNGLVYGYFAAFLAIVVYQVPWREWVLPG
ncbi:MAG: hypothetical protein ACLFPA_13260 [Dichotomicrobium sp.]